MFNLKELKVKKIKKTTKHKIEVILEDDSKAIGYPQFTPEIKVNDRVIVNTTALDLGLGTGGYHFILYNLSQRAAGGSSVNGHIMKLRYTPLQFSTMVVESPESPYHDVLTDKLSIEGLAVIIGSLHSQLPATLATAKYLNPELRITYIMTDGASLPAGLSNNIDELKEKKLLNSVITCGQAFDGDFEAINIYSALITAKFVAKADLAFVSMGPGVTGTSTLLGTTAVEVAQIINAVNALDGQAIVIPRLSFKDKRLRHQGLSHHSMTALGKLSLGPATITFPFMDKKNRAYVDKQMQLSGIDKKHNIQFVNNDVTEIALNKYGLKPTTMGRGFDEEPEFFLACGCAAVKALSLI